MDKRNEKLASKYELTTENREKLQKFMSPEQIKDVEDFYTEYNA